MAVWVFAACVPGTTGPLLEGDYRVIDEIQLITNRCNLKFFCFDNIVTATRFDPHQSPSDLSAYIRLVTGAALSPGQNEHGVLSTGTVVNVGDWIVKWRTGDLSVFSDQSFSAIFAGYDETASDTIASGLANADGASVGAQQGDLGKFYGSAADPALANTAYGVGGNPNMPASTVTDEDAIEPRPFVGQRIKLKSELDAKEFGRVLSVSDDGLTIGYAIGNSGGTGASVKEFRFYPPEPGDRELTASEALSLTEPAPTPVGIDITKTQ